MIAPIISTVLQKQTAVTAHFSSKQLLLFAFARQLIVIATVTGVFINNSVPNDHITGVLPFICITLYWLCTVRAIYISTV